MVWEEKDSSPFPRALARSIHVLWNDRERVTVKQVVKCISRKAVSASSRLIMPDRPASILGTWKGAQPIVDAIIWPLVSPTHDPSVTPHQSPHTPATDTRAVGEDESRPET